MDEPRDRGTELRQPDRMHVECALIPISSALSRQLNQIPGFSQNYHSLGRRSGHTSAKLARVGRIDRSRETTPVWRTAAR